LTDHFLTISKHTALHFARNVGVQPEFFRVIHNGVDPERFRPSEDKPSERRRLGIPSDAFVAVTVASFTPVKNHLLLLHAARKVGGESAVKYLFIGDGAKRPMIELEAKRMNLTNIVQFLGSTDHIPQYLAAADIFVLPSRLEGFSNSILEAMASGLPIVANRVGGNAELVEDGVSGLLCSSGSADELAAAITRLRLDPALRAKMGASARARVEDLFSIKAMVNNYADYYRHAHQARFPQQIY
jgi:glycosyltransferase involved in cell wall biosynthesis